MALSIISSRTIAALPITAIVANWNLRPESVWAWGAVIAMSVVMLVAQYRFERAARRSPGDIASARAARAVTGGVAFGAALIIVPLAATLAHAYGLVNDPDSSRRTTMIIIGSYLVVMGNALPKQMQPMAAMACDDARVQAFQRSLAWTWVLCGPGFTAAWLALPVEAAGPASTSLVAAAMIITIVRLLELRKPRHHAQA